MGEVYVVCSEMRVGRGELVAGGEEARCTCDEDELLSKSEKLEPLAEGDKRLEVLAANET